MISHEHKCIFIHIPKCAGTSIEKALGHLDGHEGRNGQDHRSIRLIQQPYIGPAVFKSKENIVEFLRRQKHNHINKVHNPNNKLVVNREQFAEYFKFTIVRNPWTRAYSWYKNVTRDKFHMDELGVTPDISFEDFLKRFAGHGKLKPQLYWLQDYQGNLPMDFIGRFENLAQDAATAFDKMGLSDISLPHELNGTTENYAQFYDEATDKIIRNVFAQEIERFSYVLE